MLRLQALYAASIEGFNTGGGQNWVQYTIKDVLTNKLFQHAKLLSDSNIAHSRTIGSVAVIEMPVENFIKENELVLSTAIGCNNNPSLFLSFVKDVYQSRAGALAIATGCHIDHIPDEVIAFANEHHFPLIELPWEIRFSDIIKVILEQLHQWEQDTLAKTDMIQRKLMQLYLDNHAFEDALSYLEGIFQADIYFKLSGDLAIRSSSKSQPFALTDMCLTDLDPADIHAINENFVQVVPVHSYIQEVGNVILKYNSQHASPIALIILNKAITILTLWIQKEQTLIQNRNKEIKEFIQLLLNEDTEKEVLVTASQHLSFDMQLPYVCIVGIPERSQEFTNSAKNDTIRHSEDLLDKKLLDTAESIGNTLQKKMIYAFERNLFIVFLQCTPASASEDAHSFLNEMDKYIQTHSLPMFSWGIGESHAGIFTFSKSYKNARTALEIGKSYNGPGQRSTCADTELIRILSTIAKNNTIIEFTHETIGAIAAYDNEKGLDLLHTLSTYLFYQGNVSQTSRALSLHRQSLLYRLRKIESLTNRSLHNNDDLFLLQLCLKLWSVRFEHKTYQ